MAPPFGTPDTLASVTLPLGGFAERYATADSGIKRKAEGGRGDRCGQKEEVDDGLREGGKKLPAEWPASAHRSP